MKPIVNFRFPLLLVLSTIGGILLGYLFIRIRIDLIYLIVTVPTVAIILILCCLYSRYKLLVYCLFSILFLIIGITGSYFKLKNFDVKELINGDTYTISATVSEKACASSGEYLILENAEADGQKISGKIKAFLSDSYGDFCDKGYKVTFTAKIQSNDTFPYEKLNYRAERNIKYTCFVQNEMTSEYNFSLFGYFNSAIRKTLYDNLDDDTASVAYAMLTGNSEGVEDGTVSAFRFGGIAHIFAVSGLHIGIIYSILRLLCKKLRLNKYLTLFLCVFPVFFYAGVCGFTVSSVRAFIMCSINALAQTFFVKYDALNSLSVSVIIILLINPLNLFNVGFQLSVSAVLAIILLAKSIVRPFKKINANVKNTVAVSLSAQAGTAPVMLARFGYLSGAGIILNIVLVPLLSMFFSIIFAATFLSLILPFWAEYILRYAAVPLEATLSFLVNAGFEKALISGFGAGAFIPIYYFGLFMLSDKINLKLLLRLIAVGCSFVLLCIYVPIKSYMPFSGHKIIVSASYNGGVALIKSDEGNILIMKENADFSHTQTFLHEYYANRLKAVILLGGENCVDALNNSDYNCEIYIYGKYLNIQPLDGLKINYKDSFTLGGCDFEFADGYSLLLKCDDANVGICAGNYANVKNYDLLICDCMSEAENEKAISFNNRSFENCVYDDGNFEFLIKDGKIN